MKYYLFVLLYGTAMLSANAQPGAPTEKTLLWRITGKGLSRPSYLYGTMHLPDERLFNFSDSLLLAIEKSEGLAIEVDPDEMMSVMMEQMFNDIKKTKLLKDVISKKAYTKYAPTLAKRIKKPQEEITVKDVVQEQHKWMQEAYTKGAMPTFVDIWLFDIARRQGKWTGGIEDVQDQTGIMEEVFNEQDLEFLTVSDNGAGQKYLNAMIDTYVKQDLQAIEALSNDGDSKRKDILLLHRNIKMARRMDSLAAIRSMVFAVGAAHLPGDSGVISLLRRKGFQMEPVYSSKKIAGKDYKVNGKPLVWQKIADTKGLYEVDMPGKASVLKMYDLVEMHLNINLFTSSGYLAMAMPSSVDMQNPDNALLAMARKMLENEKLKQGEAITKDGMKGREYISKSDGVFKRAQLFSSNQTVYMAYAFFTKEENISGTDATRFFQSLQLHKPQETSVGMVSFAGLLPGLQGQAPVALQPSKEMTGKMKEEGFNNQAYMGLDAKTGTVYMIISKNTINDVFIPNDSVYLNMLRSNYKSRIGKPELDTIKLEDGMYSLEQKGVLSAEQVYFHGKTYLKGNRSYSLFAIAPVAEKNKTEAEKVIQTFRMVSPPASSWATHSYNNQFSTWTPADFALRVPDTTDKEDTDVAAFNVRDTNNSYVYTVIRAAFDTSKWYNSVAAYWDIKLPDYATADDTVISRQPFSANGLNGYDLQIQKKSWPDKSRYYRLFTYGDTLYTLFSCLPASEANNPDVKRFFTDFRFNRQAAPATVFTNKAASYMAKFSSPDSAIRAGAFDNFYEVNFSRQDIPLLHQAMLQHYDWDSGNGYYSMQRMLGNKLKKLNDSTLTDFIISNYSRQNGRDEEEQTQLLYFLTSQPTTANMHFIIDALKATDGSAKINTSVIHNLDDSILLIKPLLPEILTLLRRQNMVEPVNDLVKRLLDSNVLQVKDVLLYEPEILAFGKNKLHELNSSEDGYGYDLFSVAMNAGRFKTTAGIALLKQMIASNKNDVKIQGVYGLLEAGELIPATALLAIAADRSRRTELWEKLTEKHMETLFPQAFKNQQALAESNLYDYITEDDDEPVKMSFVLMRKSTLSGKPVNVYIYKTGFKKDDEIDYHLSAIAFPASLTKLDPLPYANAILWDETYTLKNQEQQIKQLVATIRENTVQE